MRWWMVAATLVLATGCARLGPGPDGEGALERLPVLLVLEGDPLSARDAARVEKALSNQVRRPVHTTREPGMDEDALRARLRARYGRVPPGSSASDRCALGEAAAHTLAHEAHAHYRLVLRIRAGRIDGELIATTFGREPATGRLPIRAEGRRLSVPKVVAAAIAPLESPAYPLWDGLARGLLARGCPLGALAIYDARLRQRPESRTVLRAALGAGAPGAAPATVAAPAATVPTPPIAEPAARVSCKSLCELHMVELCNNDRELWSHHREPWEATPCGQMRLEQFLRECYQRQWISGTFQDACITPCERADDGRARLLHLLQGEGCARTPPS